MGLIDLLRRLFGSKPKPPYQSPKPSPPSRIVITKEYSNWKDAVRLGYDLKNAVYGGKPAKIRLYVTPEKFKLTSVKIRVSMGDKLIDEKEFSDVKFPVTTEVAVPFPGFDDGYSSRVVSIRFIIGVGEGFLIQTGSEKHGDVYVPVYEKPVWVGDNPIVVSYSETITWYRTIDDTKPTVKVLAPDKPLMYPERATVELRVLDPPFESGYAIKVLLVNHEEKECGTSKTIIQDDVEVWANRVGNSVYLFATPLKPGTHKLRVKLCVITYRYDFGTGKPVEDKKKCSEIYEIPITWEAPEQPQPPQPPQPKPKHKVTVHVQGSPSGYIFVDGLPAGYYGFKAGGACDTPGVVEVEEGEHTIQACAECTGNLGGVDTNIASCSYPYKVNVDGDRVIKAYNLGCVYNADKNRLGVVYLKSKEKFSYRVDDEAIYRFSFPDGTAVIPLPPGRHVIHLISGDIEVDVKPGQAIVKEV